MIEHQGNGWSKVEFEGKEVFIKSDYLETAEEEVIEVVPEAPAETEEQEQSTEVETAETTEEESATVTVKENVRVRKEANTDSAILGTAHTGDELELIEKQSDGWTKVKYKGHTAFVKSDYVE